jgi:hypothetical protein
MSFASYRHLKGFSLIEVLLGLSLSLMLILIATTVWLKALAFNEAMLREKSAIETQLYLEGILQREIARAGYGGCLPIGKLSLKTHSASPALFTTAISGYTFLNNTTFSPKLPVLLQQKKPRSDILILHYLSFPTTDISAPMITASDPISVTETSSMQTNGLAVISDCQSGDFFRVSRKSSTTLYHSMPKNKGTALSKTYGMGSSVGMFVGDIFFSAQSSIDPNVESLYFQQGDDHAEVLLSPISDLHFSFATVKAPDTFLPAKNITDFNKVVRVKISLLYSPLEQPFPISFIVGVPNAEI